MYFDDISSRPQPESKKAATANSKIDLLSIFISEISCLVTVADVEKG
jgi:hypothetical protein